MKSLIMGVVSCLLGSAAQLVACNSFESGGESVDSVALPLTQAGVSGTLTVYADWKAGYCATVTLENGSPTPVTGWSAVVSVGSVTLTTIWNGTYTSSGTSINVNAASYNSNIAVGSSTDFGFCALGTDRPRLTALNIVGAAQPKYGFATRQWDCCKPTCGWRDNVAEGNTPVSSCSLQNQSYGTDYTLPDACAGGSAYLCHSFVPASVCNSLSYGFAAFHDASCGDCYELSFDGTGKNAAAAALAGKRMIVQVISRTPLEANQFDIFIPGGGAGLFNACSTQWGTSDLGPDYGGFLAQCGDSKSCVREKCQTVFGDKPELMAGCNWFLDWFNAADIPNLVYRPVKCPQALTDRSGMIGLY